MPNRDQQPAAFGPVHAAHGLFRSFGYALLGIGYCFRSQRNFRIHILLGALAALLGIGLGITPGEWALLALTISVVLAAEMVNTVVEAAVDLASPQYHPLAKVAKDVAAGAVLVGALGAVGVGAGLFLPRLLALLPR